jgi:type IV pilus assembly protein PilC
MVSQMIRIGRGDRRARADARQGRRLLRGRGRRVDPSLTSIIEPIMMIGVGAMVGVIVISMYLPMFKNAPARPLTHPFLRTPYTRQNTV